MYAGLNSTVSSMFIGRESHISWFPNIVLSVISCKVSPSESNHPLNYLEVDSLGSIIGSEQSLGAEILLITIMQVISITDCTI